MKPLSSVHMKMMQAYSNKSRAVSTKITSKIQHQAKILRLKNMKQAVRQRSQSIIGEIRLIMEKVNPRLSIKFLNQTKK